MKGTTGNGSRRARRRIAVLATLALAALALGINTYVTDRETKEARADVGQLVEVHGQDLQIKEGGAANRPSLVLIHGLASSIPHWDKLLPRLARRYRVVRIDLLGHGGSDKPRGGYAPQAQARRIEGLLKKLGIRRAVVVGHSLGGMIGVALAERRPRLVRGLVAIATPARPDDSDLSATARIGTLPVAGELLYRLVPDAMVRDALQDALGPNVEVSQEFIDDYRDMTFSSYRASFRDGIAFGEERSLDERMSRSGVPLLALMGTDDKLVKPRALDRWAKVPGAAVATFPGGGHALHWEDPVRTAQLISSFERRLPQ